MNLNQLLNLLDWLIPKHLGLGQHVEPQLLLHPLVDQDRVQALLDITGLLPGLLIFEDSMKGFLFPDSSFLKDFMLVSLWYISFLDTTSSTQ